MLSSFFSNILKWTQKFTVLIIDFWRINILFPNFWKKILAVFILLYTLLLLSWSYSYGFYHKAVDEAGRIIWLQRCVFQNLSKCVIIVTLQKHGEKELKWYFCCVFIVCNGILLKDNSIHFIDTKHSVQSFKLWALLTKALWFACQLHLNGLWVRSNWKKRISPLME
jgi:hypothetical protein